MEPIIALLAAVGEHTYSIEVDAGGQVLRVLSTSPRFWELIGRRDAPLGYLELVAHIQPEDRVGPYPASAIAAGRWQKELRIRRADGAEAIVWDRAVCRSRDPDSGRMIWDGVVADITERRGTETEAAQAAMRMEAVLGGTAAALIELDLPRRVAPRLRFATQGTPAVVGGLRRARGGRLTVDALLEAIHHEDRGQLLEDLGRVRAGETVDAEYRLAARMQHVRRIRVRIAPQILEDGTVRRAVGLLVAMGPAPGARPPSLTPRQLEILGLIATGMRTDEIAEQLTISPATARNHITAILAALQARSRLEAVAAARRAGLI